MGCRFYIIGVGMGGEETLTFEAKSIIEKSDCVIAPERLAKALIAVRSDIETASFSDFTSIAAKKDGIVSFLVSGDAGFFSAAKKLISELDAMGETTIICGMSSMQYFCAKLKVSYDDAVILSLHGRNGSLLGAVSYAKKVFALTGGKYSADIICKELSDNGLSGVKVSIGENLGSDSERILTGTAKSLANERIPDLAVMLIENERAVNANMPLRDNDFIRGEVPMTKEEVRLLSAAKLQVQPGDIVFDVGAGTGSVTMQLAKNASRGVVYAIEKNDKALALIAENRDKTGCFNVKIIAAYAPDGFDGLPAPDCAFIGGSSGNMRDILQKLQTKNPQIRIVINVIALESLHEAVTAMEALGFSDVEIVQICASKAKKIGKYNMMTAHNPVYIISGGGRCDC